MTKTIMNVAKLESVTFKGLRIALCLSLIVDWPFRVCYHERSVMAFSRLLEGGGGGVSEHIIVLDDFLKKNILLGVLNPVKHW